jgi:hypothetical protein
MPTKIVLNKTPAPGGGRTAPPRPQYEFGHRFARPVLTGHRRNRSTNSNEDNSRVDDEDDRSSPTRTIDSTRLRRTSSIKKRRSIVTFQSSLLRELSVRGEDDPLQITSSGDQDSATREMVRLSSDDIRASRRLTGYMFAMTAAAVKLVSVVQYVQ